jgi:hypothetical protein
MKKSIRDIAKKGRGRPKSTGLGTGILVRMHDQLDELDAWIAKQHIELSRPEAIRRLVEIALKARTSPTKVTITASRKKRAAELAAQAIDGMIDPKAAPEERDRRRQRLTKGPLEFREDRVDQPMKK